MDAEKVKADIHNALAKLRDELGRYEQTTHGSLFPRGADIDLVCQALSNAYRHPTSFTVSELDQVIRGFLKAESTP